MKPITIAQHYTPTADVVLFQGDCLELLRECPEGSAALIVTSPPYNVGKEYEEQMPLNEYIAWQSDVIAECVKRLHPRGSICWQVGNYVESGEVYPLDCLLYPVFKNLGLQLRNRIVWHFGHGLHCTKRFSGRHETILWFTKGNDYHFDLDPIRVPQKYPEKKHYKGENAGKLSGNPMGKNPSDVWDIPNVKSNHVEKTIHPCQFPVGLIERLILSMTVAGDLVVDPFMGAGTVAVAAFRHGRRSAGAEMMGEYVTVAQERLMKESRGCLHTRPMNRHVYDPDAAHEKPNGDVSETNDMDVAQPRLALL